MGERERLFLGLLAGGGFGAVLGGIFGAIVGTLTWRDGRAAGTPLGLRVARAYAADLTPGAKGAIVGGVDGFAFLGVAGLLLAGLAGWQGQLTWEHAWPAGLAAAGLVGGALFFGLLAAALQRAGVRAVAGLFAGGILGALIGVELRGTAGLLPGALAGILIGTLAALFTA